MVDYAPTRRPAFVTNHLAEIGLLGKPIGIYGMVSKVPLAYCVWRGKIQDIKRSITINDEELNLTLKLFEINSSVGKLANALTFGAYQLVLETQLSRKFHSFENSHIIKNLGFFPADLNNKRFFKHFEIFSHADETAWDVRLINLRVQHDLRRDIGYSLAEIHSDAEQGSFSFGGEYNWLETYNNRLETLDAAIRALGEALRFQPDGTEALYHQILEDHPVLLDIYGACESKPELAYPQGQTSPIGKTKLQPDFIIRYPDESYKLIEIERPSKPLATVQGQPRAEVSQAIFQTAEWKNYIKAHYSLIAKRYPGIHSKCKTSVIMSRFTQHNFKNASEARNYMGLVRDQYNIDEFLTFDDLLERAVTAYTMLSGLPPQQLK